MRETQTSKKGGNNVREGKKDGSILVLVMIRIRGWIYHSYTILSPKEEGTMSQSDLQRTEMWIQYQPLYCQPAKEIITTWVGRYLPRVTSFKFMLQMKIDLDKLQIHTSMLA